MKIMLVLAVLLCGCARHEPVAEAVSALDSQIVATEQAALALHSSIPKSCLTNSVESQFKALFADIKATRGQLTSVYATAQSQLSVYKAREKTHALINILLAGGCLVLLFGKFKRL